MRKPIQYVTFRRIKDRACHRGAIRIPSVIEDHVAPFLISDRFVAFGLPIRDLPVSELRVAVGFALRYLGCSGVLTKAERKAFRAGAGLPPELIEEVRRLIASDRFTPFGVSIRVMRRRELVVTLAYVLLYPNPRDSPFDPDHRPRNAGSALRY